MVMVAMAVSADCSSATVVMVVPVATPPRPAVMAAMVARVGIRG